MLAWLFLTPILLLVLGVPIFICIVSVMAIFKKPRTVRSTEVELPGNLVQGVEEP